MEVWKQIEDTMFSISNYGNIRNDKTGIILKTQSNDKGYQVVRVTINRIKRTFRIHRLVAEYFLDNPEHKEQVNHIDCNKNNNRADNLEWCTNKENVHHAIKNGLWKSVFDGALKENDNRKKKILAKNIDNKEEKIFESVADAERYFNTRHITDVLKGKRSQAKGYHFSYIGGDDTKWI